MTKVTRGVGEKYEQTDDSRAKPRQRNVPKVKSTPSCKNKEIGLFPKAKVSATSIEHKSNTAIFFMFRLTTKNHEGFQR